MSFYEQWGEVQRLLDAAADTPRRVVPLDVEPKAQWPLPYTLLIDQLRNYDAVLIGELHDDPASHRLELELASTLMSAADVDGRGFTVAAEMFERDVQTELAAYGRPQIDVGAAEARLLATARPWSNYAADYRPVVELLRMRAQPLHASNAPTALSRRVAREGLEAVLLTLSAEERGWIAEETSAPRDEYWQRFLEAMGGGASADAHSGGMSEEQIYRFYQAQCLKDDTMAETIARLRDQDPSRQVVHLSGSFHIDYHLGIYPRLKQRRPEDRIVTVAIRPVADFAEATLRSALEAEPGVADYVVFVIREEPPQADPGAP